MSEVAKGLSGEYGNIALLLLLYVLQAVPMGLFGFVSMEVKELFKDSFSEQGTFMLAAWPFSLKLLWAPLVDCWYIERLGRRKTWMVPAQIAIGLIMLYLAPRIEVLFESKDVSQLTFIFFILYLLCATQDIAVDGWALTMLRSENAGYASTCNAVGQTIGYTIGFMFPMSKLVPLPDFIYFWGTVFVATTLAVWLLKAEAPTPPEEKMEGLAEAYSTMKSVLSRRPVQLFALHLFTRSLTFMPSDVMASGRLQDMGFRKENLAKIKLCITPLEIVLPWVLSKVTAGPYPLSVVVAMYIPRALLSPAAGLFAWWVGQVSETSRGVYAGVAVLCVLQDMASNAMFVAHMAFFAKVSDPAIGGTYMTFLNTLHNIGNMWAATFCLKAADQVKAHLGLDGFYFLSAACFLYGIIWFIIWRPLLTRLQELPLSEWRVQG